MAIVSVSDPLNAASRGTAQQAIDFAVANHAGGPYAEYITEVYRLAPLVTLDAVLVVAQSSEETDHWSASSVWWASRNNPAGMGVTGDPIQNQSSPTFATGTQAARAQIAHLLLYTTGAISRGGLTSADDPRYADYIAAFGHTARVAKLSDLGSGNWAADANYAANIAAHANAILAVPISSPAPPPAGGPPVTTYPSYPVAGLATPIVLPVPLIQSIIPAGQTNQRPGIKRQTPGFWVQHETANTAAGADAAMHARYLANGADGSQVSWHFTVDDHQIIQHIPIDEVTWQAADGSGPGNMSGVSCELCVNVDGDKALIRRNGEALCGTICAALGLTVDQIKRHYDFNQADPNRHHCPDEMMNENYWPQFCANAGVVIAANSGSPTPAPVPTPATTTTPAPTPPVYATLKPIPAPQVFTTIAAVTPRQTASPSAPPTGPELPAGSPILINGVLFSGATKSYWYVGADGTRYPIEAFVKVA